MMPEYEKVRLMLVCAATVHLSSVQVLYLFALPGPFSTCVAWTCYPVIRLLIYFVCCAIACVQKLTPGPGRVDHGGQYVSVDVSRNFVKVLVYGSITGSHDFFRNASQGYKSLSM